MSPNPYNPPQAEYGMTVSQPSRTPFLLAAAGAGLASAYWAVMTILIALGVASGAGSAGSLALPCVLIVLYAVRGYRLYKGERKAVTQILWLHAIGAVAAAFQAAAGMLVVMQIVKIGIHVFGGVAALMARRALVNAEGSALGQQRGA